MQNQTENFEMYTGRYINIPAILDLGFPYTIIVAMRGGGKTYGALQEMVNRRERFIYFRRTDRSLKMCVSPYYHVFRELNLNNGWKIEPDYNRELNLGVFRDPESEEIIGYAANLSTFAGIRSIGSAKALGIKWLIFDEFIPQQGEAKRYNIFDAWSNADETLTRNSSDDWPVRRLLMANSDTIRGDVIAGYGIGDTYMMMQETGQEITAYSQDMVLLRPGCAELAAFKADTPLYRVTAGSHFSDVALRNTFLISDRSKIGKRNLGEYTPVCGINHIFIYRHKTRRGEYYVSPTAAGKMKIYKEGSAETKRYLRDQTALWRAYLKGKMYYETLQVQTVFLQIYDEE